MTSQGFGVRLTPKGVAFLKKLEYSRSERCEMCQDVPKAEKLSNNSTHLTSPDATISKNFVFRLKELVKQMGKDIPKPEIESRFPKEIIEKWLKEGLIADWGDFYSIYLDLGDSSVG